MRMTRSFSASGSITRRNAVNSGVQSRKRQAWVIARGSLQAKRKEAGVLSAQRRTDFSAGACVEGGVEFDRGKIVRVEFEPAFRRQVGWIKGAAPFLEAPGAGAEADLLLGGEIQKMWLLKS